MKRTVVTIDEDRCNGCGFCVQGCHEGALQVIDGKAQIINETFCDGLGACIGECPRGAIGYEERESLPYDEYAVMALLSSRGENTLRAHLLHLKEHGEMEYFNQGLHYLKEHGIAVDMAGMDHAGGCPGSAEKSFVPAGAPENGPAEAGSLSSPVSQLSQWPVQLHLLNPHASFFRDADVILAADCSAYAFGGFHSCFLKNHILAIACPKLDTGKEKYVEKITALADSVRINTLSVITMEVPCCGGLLELARQGLEKAERAVPVKQIVIGIRGAVLKEEWVQ
jgi:ferredoxin